MDRIGLILTAVFIFCIAVCGSMAVDYVREGKSFRFGLALGGVIYMSLLMNAVLFS